METWKIVLTSIVVVGVPILGVWLWVKIYNSENGERYIKMRMQGPFVPLGKEEIAEDERRNLK
ncbi:MAG: hypothetical protein V4488_21610 [Pseudomonadota bacterium]